MTAVIAFLLACVLVVAFFAVLELRKLVAARAPEPIANESEWRAHQWAKVAFEQNERTRTDGGTKREPCKRCGKPTLNRNGPVAYCGTCHSITEAPNART